MPYTAGDGGQGTVDMERYGDDKTLRQIDVDIEGRTVEMTRRQIKMLRSLTTTQRRVALGVLEGLEPGEIAERHDINPGTVSQAKRAPAVTAFIDSFAQERTDQAIMGRDEMLRQYTAIARTTLDDVLVTYTGRKLMDMDTGEIVDGQTLWSLRPIEDMRNGGMAAIKKLTATRQGLTVELHDTNEARKRIAEMQGYDAPKRVEVSNAPTLEDFYASLADDGSDRTDG